MPKRLLLLFELLLALTAFLMLRLWFSPAAVEQRLAGLSREQLEKSLERGSTDPLVYHTLARKRMEVGDYAGAADALESALRVRPKFARARATLGTVLMAMDRDPEASLQLKQAIQDDPQAPDGYMGLALLYQRNGAWHLQAQAAEMASQLEPRNADAWILRGQAVAAQGNHGAAAGCFARAQQAAPSDPRPPTLHSVEQVALGDFQRAEELARLAVRLGPKDAAAHAALGNVLVRLGRDRLPEAEKAFSMAVSLGEASGRANLGLARVLLRQGRAVEAEQQFRLALRRNPAVSDAHYGLAQALRAQGKEAEAAGAEKQFRDWVQFDEQTAKLNDQVALDPENARAWFNLARLYADRQLWPSARRYVLSGLRRAPADREGQKLLERINGHRP